MTAPLSERTPGLPSPQRMVAGVRSQSAKRNGGSSETAATRAQRQDRHAVDHLPACGRCGDVGEPGADVCEGCGSRLLVYNVAARPTLAQLAEAARETPEPERSDLVGYWLSRYTAEELAEFIAGVAE